eukprot:gene37455-48993_t
MGKFHHSKKSYSAEKRRGSSKPKYDILSSGRKKLPDDFVYTQHHKSIWNSFCNFFDKRLAEEDLADILDEDEITRIKTAPTIPPLLEFEPANPGDIEAEEAKRARSIEAKTEKKWERRARAAIPKSASSPVDDPEPIAPVKGPDKSPPVKGPEPKPAQKDESTDSSWNSKKQKLLEQGEM